MGADPLVNTATATGTFCHDTGSNALVGSVGVRSAVIDSLGNLTTVDVQQKGSLGFAQQEPATRTSRR